MVAICDCFSVLGGLLIVPVGGGGDFAGCVQSRELGAYPLHSEVYPAGKFR